MPLPAGIEESRQSLSGLFGAGIEPVGVSEDDTRVGLEPCRLGDVGFDSGSQGVERTMGAQRQDLTVQLGQDSQPGGLSGPAILGDAD